jgi:hypothetical protein
MGGCRPGYSPGAGDCFVFVLWGVLPLPLSTRPPPGIEPGTAGLAPSHAKHEPLKRGNITNFGTEIINFVSFLLCSQPS